jgi:hypothetical protein
MECGAELRRIDRYYKIVYVEAQGARGSVNVVPISLHGTSERRSDWITAANFVISHGRSVTSTGRWWVVSSFAGASSWSLDFGLGCGMLHPSTCVYGFPRRSIKTILRNDQ